ncbi:hypothetical protein GCM10007967_31490 [Xylanimonas ulmi]
MLSLVVAAGIAGATRVTLVLDWAHDQPAGIGLGFGFSRGWTSARTVNRVLERVDHARFDEITHAWLAARGSRRRRASLAWPTGEPGSWTR